MAKKIYPNNKIITKKPEDIIAYDFVPAAAQQIFNYVLACALKNQNNVIKIKIADYFCWLNTPSPQGKTYAKFYQSLELLTHTFIVANEFEENKKIKYKWPLISETKMIYTAKNKIDKIEITLNPSLLNYFQWQRANVPIDIDVAKYLTEKYAYRLYEYLRYQLRKKAKNNYIIISDLRRILTVPATERNERFLVYLQRAIKNINETTELKIQAKIRTKNKKSLASAEIKFENYAEKIAEKKFEFLLFERDFNAQNAD